MPRASSRSSVRADPVPHAGVAAGRRPQLLGDRRPDPDRTYHSPAGLRAKNWPDGNQVATPRPAVVHTETDTFLTTYTAIDPARSAGTTVSLDGFFGWPVQAVAS